MRNAKDLSLLLTGWQVYGSEVHPHVMILDKLRGQCPLWSPRILYPTNNGEALQNTLLNASRWCTLWIITCTLDDSICWYYLESLMQHVVGSLAAAHRHSTAAGFNDNAVTFRSGPTELKITKGAEFRLKTPAGATPAHRRT